MQFPAAVTDALFRQVLRHRATIFGLALLLPGGLFTSYLVTDVLATVPYSFEVEDPGARALQMQAVMVRP